jgi:chemotaxis protein histidine kinase CheA
MAKKAKKSGTAKAKAKAPKKARTAAQKEATRKLVASNKARAKGTLKAKPSKAKPSKAKPSKAKPSKAKGSGLEARVSKLERTVQNHGEVLSNVVGVLEEHDRALSSLNDAFGMGAARGPRENRTVMMETVPN